jgi:cobalt-zinc-cadmium resistance protein CzcA
MPTMDEGDLIVGIEKLPSISLEQTATGPAIQQALMQAVPEITGIVARPAPTRSAWTRWG